MKSEELKQKLEDLEKDRKKYRQEYAKFDTKIRDSIKALQIDNYKIKTSLDELNIRISAQDKALKTPDLSIKKQVKPSQM